MGCFWPKYIMLELKKNRGVMFDDTQDWYKILRKADLCFQKSIEEFGKVLPEHLKVFERTFMASFYRKLKMHELKIYRGIMCHDNEEWYKNWRGIGLSFQSWHKKFGKFWLDHWKVSKMYTLMGCFWPTYIIFELRKYRWVCLMALKRLMQSLKGNWLMLPKMNWGIWQIFIRGRSKV